MDSTSAASQTSEDRERHLPATLNAVRSIPEALQPSLLALCDREYQEGLRALRGTMSIHSRAILVESVRLHVMSTATSMAMLPWQALRGQDELDEVHRRLGSPNPETAVREFLNSLEPRTVFVAGQPGEDQATYAQRVLDVLKSIRYRAVVLDAALFDPRDDAARLQMATRLGVRGMHVFVYPADKAAQHAAMQRNPLFIRSTPQAPKEPTASPAPAAVAQRQQRLRQVTRKPGM